LIFFHHYSSDDYGPLLGEFPSHELFISQGRVGEYVIRLFLTELGINPYTLSSTIGVTHNLVLTASALLLLRLFSLRLDTGPALICALLFVLHPFQSEQQTFQAWLWSADIATALTFCGLFASTRGRVGLLGGVAALTVAFLTYQTSIQYAATTLCFVVVLNFARNLTATTPSPWVVIISDRRLWTMVACVLSSLIVTAVIDVALLHAYAIETTPRAVPIALSFIPTRLAQFWASLIENNVLFSTPLKAAFLGLAVVSVVVLGIRGRVWESVDRSAQLATVAVGVIAAIIASYGIVLLGNDWWPVARALVAVSVWCAGVAALAYVAFPKRFHLPLTVLGAIVTLIFAAGNNEVGVDQTRLNLRDHMMANRIIERLEQDPGFNPDIRMAVVGNDWRIHLSNIRTGQGNLNITAFATDWSRLAILREISGYSLPDATAAQENEAIAYCRGHSTWPAPDSVVVINQLAIACLEKQ